MARIEDISSLANVKQKTAADTPAFSGFPSTLMYVTTSSPLQVTLNLPWGVDTRNTANFDLTFDGDNLTEGPGNDFVFSAIAGNGISSQVTFLQPLPGGRPLKARNMGIVLPTPAALSFATLQAQVNTPPQTFYLTNTTVSTFTVPAGARYLDIEMIGAGGAGGAAGSTAGSGGPGGTASTFDTLSAPGGGGGADATVGGAGGVPGGVSSGGDLNLNGGYGFDAMSTGSGGAGCFGGNGGVSPLGGAGRGGYTGSAFSNADGAAANTGSGGGGGGGPTLNGFGGGGGASGSYLKKRLTALAPSYSYQVGAGGPAVSGTGVNFSTSGAGADGIIIVTAYF